VTRRRDGRQLGVLPASAAILYGVLAGLERAKAQGVTLGRPKVARKVENAIRARLARGEGILKVAKGLGVGVSTVQTSCPFLPWG
jgi:DNA invertase Pin-like site-specific DNA recombinase